MRITTKSRYAIRAIYALVRLNGENEPVPLNKISEYEDISFKYLEQIFSKLKKNNIVKSIRGTSGGYMLFVPPANITIKDIIYAMDGPIKPVDCIDNGGCIKSSECAINWLWFKMKENLDNFFENITFEDLRKKHI